MGKQINKQLMNNLFKTTLLLAYTASEANGIKSAVQRGIESSLNFAQVKDLFEDGYENEVKDIFNADRSMHDFLQNVDAP